LHEQLARSRGISSPGAAGPGVPDLDPADLTQIPLDNDVCRRPQGREPPRMHQSDVVCASYGGVGNTRGHPYDQPSIGDSEDHPRDRGLVAEIQGAARLVPQRGLGVRGEDLRHRHHLPFSIADLRKTPIAQRAIPDLSRQSEADPGLCSRRRKTGRGAAPEGGEPAAD